MRIWHITPYDTIPGEGWRSGRAITMAKMLSEQGHQVVWWTSNYSHFFKCHRSHWWKDISISPNLKITLVPVPGYKRHVGLNRLFFHITYAWRLYFKAKREKLPPDCIILALPTPGADFVAVKLAKHFGARLIIDIRDLWPELFKLAFPIYLRWLAPPILYPLYALRRYSIRNTDAITAVSKTYLEAALLESPHLKKLHPHVIYFGADVAILRYLISQARIINKIIKPSDELWAIYAGTLGEMYDIQTILDAAILLRKSEAKIKILIAGSGPLRDKIIDFKKLYKLDNIIYLGVLTFNDLARYYSVSDIGLSTYFKESTVVMPAKVYDYLAAGLPIVNSLSGELEEFLHETNTGVQYMPGNAKSLSLVLKQLAEDVTRRSFLSQNAYNVALRFERQTNYLRFLDLLSYPK